MKIPFWTSADMHVSNKKKTKWSRKGNISGMKLPSSVMRKCCHRSLSWCESYWIYSEIYIELSVNIKLLGIRHRLGSWLLVVVTFNVVDNQRKYVAFSSKTPVVVRLFCRSGIFFSIAHKVLQHEDNVECHRQQTQSELDWVSSDKGPVCIMNDVYNYLKIPEHWMKFKSRVLFSTK